MLGNFEDKSARAECRVALKVPGKDPLVFTGVCEGNIVHPRGQSNFGWDPIFEPKNRSQTFAEMPIEEKTEISHRGNAMKYLLDYIKNNPNWLS